MLPKLLVKSVENGQFEKISLINVLPVWFQMYCNYFLRDIINKVKEHRFYLICIYLDGACFVLSVIYQMKLSKPRITLLSVCVLSVEW